MKFTHYQTDIDIGRTFSGRQEAEPDPAVVRFDLPGPEEIQVIIPEIHNIGFDQATIDPEAVFGKSRLIDPLDQVETEAVTLLV